MAIAYDNYGTSAEGTTSVSPLYPASVASGNLLVLSVVNKYPAAPPSTPAGWTLIGSASGGAGASGANTGEVIVTAWYKVAAGTEASTDSVAVTVTNGNSVLGVIVKFSNANGFWDIAATGGADTSAGTGWSVTGSSDPGAVAGDLYYCVTGANSSAYGWSGRSMSQTGITFGTHTEIGEVATNQGDNLDTIYTYHTVTDGTSSAAPVHTQTAGGSDANSPAGASLIIRLRQDSDTRSGELAKTLTGLSISSAGDVAVSCVLSQTMTGLSLSSAGTIDITGVLSQTITGLGLSSAGTVDISGALSSTFTGLVLVATGTVTSGTAKTGGGGSNAWRRRARVQEAQPDDEEEAIILAWFILMYNGIEVQNAD